MKKYIQHHPPKGRVVSSASGKRDGATLIVVLVCLGLITSLMFTAFQSSLKQRRQLDRELQMEQTRWLAKAGLAHGMTLLKTEDGLGESPITLKPELAGDRESKVQIEFENSDNETTITAKAWIGNNDRPEQNTNIELSRTTQTAPQETPRSGPQSLENSSRE